MPPAPVQQEVRIGDYLIRVCRREGVSSPVLNKLASILPSRFQNRVYSLEPHEPGVLQVKKGWRTVLQKRGYLFTLLQSSEQTRIPSDLNGDSIPDFAVEEFTGGAHCCSTLLIYECGPTLRKIAEIEGEHSGVKLEDLDQDGVPELLLNDWTFQYWPYDFVGTPAPLVVLRWNGRKHVVAPDLMSKPPPSDTEMTAEAARIRLEAREFEAFGLGPPSAIFGYALCLMYSGHEELGWAFLRTHFGTELKDSPLIDELKDLLNKSPYWHQIRGSAGSAQ